MPIFKASSSILSSTPPPPASRGNFLLPCPRVYLPEARPLAYDMMYGIGLTPFLQFAQEQGAARFVNGLGMLVEQAAESSFVWRGIRPKTAPVIEMLRSRTT